MRAHSRGWRRRRPPTPTASFQPSVGWAQASKCGRRSSSPACWLRPHTATPTMPPGTSFRVHSAPQLIYELGVKQIAQRTRVYQDLAQYKAQYSGADLSRFAFNEISRQGQSRYITAVSGQQTDATYGLADYYGFKTGKLATDARRNVTALRIDGPDELDWLLTLGAVVRTEDGQSLSKGR